MEENKMKSHSNNDSKPKISDTDYGFDGLVRMFTELEIDSSDWLAKRLDKERGGVSFALPSAYGEIYLSWGDLYNIDVTFVNSEDKFKATLMLGELHEIMKKLETQRLDEVNRLRDLLKKTFKSEDSSGTEF
tara:strand:- start:3396 stop:3791 length:396 start_codon:yes stop_codon:yes gene_type:complete